MTSEGDQAAQHQFLVIFSSIHCQGPLFGPVPFGKAWGPLWDSRGADAPCAPIVRYGLPSMVRKLHVKLQSSGSLTSLLEDLVLVFGSSVASPFLPFPGFVWSV